MSDCGTGSTNTRMGDAAPAVPDGSLTERSTCFGSKADAELLMGAGTRRGRARRPGPKRQPKDRRVLSFFDKDRLLIRRSTQRRVLGYAYRGGGY